MGSLIVAFKVAMNRPKEKRPVDRPQRRLMGNETSDLRVKERLAVDS